MMTFCDPTPQPLIVTKTIGSSLEFPDIFPFLIEHLILYALLAASNPSFDRHDSLAHSQSNHPSWTKCSYSRNPSFLLRFLTPDFDYLHSLSKTLRRNLCNVSLFYQYLCYTIVTQDKKFKPETKTYPLLIIL